METGTAIQVTDENTLKTLDRILPDKKSSFRKPLLFSKIELFLLKKEQNQEIQKEKIFIQGY